MVITITNDIIPQRKAANALPRSFSLKIYRMLSLSSVLTPTEKRFVREMFSLCDCYICCLNVVFSNVLMEFLVDIK